MVRKKKQKVVRHDGVKYVRLGPYGTETKAKRVAGRERVTAGQIGFSVKRRKWKGKWWVYREVEP